MFSCSLSMFCQSLLFPLSKITSPQVIKFHHLPRSSTNISAIKSFILSIWTSFLLFTDNRLLLMTYFMVGRTLVTRNTTVNNLPVGFFFSFSIFKPKERQKRGIAVCEERYDGRSTRFYGDTYKGNLAQSWAMKEGFYELVTSMLRLESEFTTSRDDD